MPPLSISPDKVCYLIARIRHFQAKVAPVEPNPGSNMIDDAFREIIEDYGNDAVAAEIRQFVGTLNEEEHRDVLILLLLGRGDYGKEEWKALVAEAETVRAQRGADYFLGLPLLAEHLEDGLNLLGYSCGPAA